MANKLCGTREILFRGKRILNGKWVEGLPSYDADGHITEIEAKKKPNKGYFIYVDPKTICQYTGLTDKNGRKIFEGDIIKAMDSDGESETGDVSFNDEEGAWYVNGELQDRLYWLFDVIDYEFEVIGNIFDNPELIEQGDDAE